MIQNLVKDLGLNSGDQFALYLKVNGELRCIKPDEFLLDALRLTMPDIQLQVPQKHSITSRFLIWGIMRLTVLLLSLSD